MLAFPGVFRGALDAGARRITEEMKVAAAEAIFSVVRRRPGAGPDRSRARWTRGSRQRSPPRWRPPQTPRVTAGRLTALALLAALAVVGLRPQPRRRAPSWWSGPAPDVESTLLADVYAGALRSYGFAARTEAAPDPLAKLDSGRVQSSSPRSPAGCCRSFQPGATVRSDAQVYRAMIGALPEGIAAGDYATAAEDKPALVVTQPTAKPGAAPT